MSRSRGHAGAPYTDGRAPRGRQGGTAIRIVERSLGVVAAIGAAVAILMARSSTLVNREIAWTSSSAAEARPLPRPVRFADSTALFAAVDRYVEEQRREGRVPGSPWRSSTAGASCTSAASVLPIPTGGRSRRGRPSSWAR
ncbi:MAG TPA: hypothetical protein VF832_15710 [Longimicrobiales bacterium]